MSKVILNLDESTLNITDNTGAFVGSLSSIDVADTVNAAGELTLQLVKQGVSVDEIKSKVVGALGAKLLESRSDLVSLHKNPTGLNEAFEMSVGVVIL